MLISGIHLKDGEEAVAVTKPSTMGLVATWLSVPVFIFLYFCFFYLPTIIKKSVSSSIKGAVNDAIGSMESSGEKYIENTTDGIVGNIFGNALDGVFSFFKGLFIVMLVVLVLVWIGICIVMTFRYFRYSLALTNLRVVGKANDDFMDSPLDEVINVHIEQSLWGKLFKYGSVTVRTKKKTLTFKNIDNPKIIYDKIMNIASDYCSH